jgi:glycerol-3-phosphate dehydrogenase (NAD(P)+)
VNTARGPRIAVLGAGSWGTALAVLCARNARPVLLWGHNPEHMARIEADRRNERYLPGIDLPAGLSVHDDLAEVAAAADHYLVVVPSHAFRQVLKDLHGQPAFQASQATIVAWGTKGLEPGRARLLSDVARDVLGGAVRLGVLSGPTFAREIGRGLPAALTAASEDPAAADAMSDWLRNDHVRVYTSQDVVGVQLGGATKNVMAIAAGISDGLGFGANARAALITRGLAEMSRLGVALGGRVETFMGLAGLGDLVLTCTDDQSRNRRVGLGLGKGRGLDGILEELGQEAEGVRTTAEVRNLAAGHGVDMPITEQVHRVLHDGVPAQEAVEDLLHRRPKKEFAPR